MTEHKRHDAGSLPNGIKSLVGVSRKGDVLSPGGKHMTLADLPPVGTRRWVIRRKAEVVAGVHGGLISLNEACRRYQLSVDEFRSWEKLLEKHGLPGLRVTQVKKYRRQNLNN
ncbi:MAG: DUF1153 domain-containing protein [Rhodospirillales bacterium]